MINRLALTNFKSIGKTLIVKDEEITEGKLDFAPLTIFCGKNSSGKSTLLQSILLLAQTLQNNVKTHTFVLNGPIVKLGTVERIKSDFNNSGEVNIDIDFYFSKPPKKISELSEELSNDEQGVFIESLSKLYNYTISNNLSEIEYAINKRTGYFINLENVNWQLNPNLATEVKELMNKYNVIYSMTFWSDYENDIINIVINKQLNSEWFSALYKIPYLDFVSSIASLVKSFDNTHNKNNKQSLNLFISFNNKSSNDISDIIPIIKKLSIGISGVDNFSAIYKEKSEDLTFEDENFYSFDIKLDKINQKSLEGKKPIGLYLNHFLPEYIVYINDKKDYSILFVNYFLRKYIYKFLDDNYQFNNLSVKEFHSSVRGLFKLISPSKNDEKEYINQIISSKDIEITDKNTYKQYIEKCISILERIDIKKLYQNYISSLIKIDTETDYSKFKNEKHGLRDFLEYYVNCISNYFLRNVSYIGPLREEPYFQYAAYVENVTKIGYKGENSAAILYHNKLKHIKCITPSNLNNSFDENDCSLIDATNEWLRYIGAAENISATFNGRYGYGLEIFSSKENKNPDALTSVGVGLSQVLPIILSCLLAPKESTIIIEQPELHLHPAMQSKLLDLFIATIKCNKQIIIETHSEHIINALRYRVAKISSPDDEMLANDIQIYFVEKNEKGTLFKSITIDKYADISDWPKDFFDESQLIREEIIEAVGKKLERDFPDE